MQKRFQQFLSAAVILLFAASCQKMDRPALGSYPTDANSPTGPLSFYAAFDGSSSNSLMNAVDSIRALFPADNPFTSGTGISGKCLSGVNQKYVKYSSFNTWASSSSFSISLWFKQNGQTKNNAGTNGPNHLISIKAKDGYHWSGGIFLCFLEGDNTGCAVKVMTVNPSNLNDPANSAPIDNWFTWEGGQVIPGICDNNWHHMVLTYDETTSNMKLYIDGVQNPNVKSWGGHGKMRFTTENATEYRVGAGPSTSYSSDDWLAGTMKGSLDQLRLYSKVLSTAEISALYTTKK
ncbi:MAG: LamG-like jellyroll fold domain-containing protein [Ferruginibacter sp.]